MRSEKTLLEKTNLVGAILLILLGVSLPAVSAFDITQYLEWKVVIGDTMIYTVSKYYGDDDNDGDFSQDTHEIEDDEGNLVNVTMKMSISWKCEITELNDVARVKTTIDGVTLKNPHTFLLMKTTDNQTFWEENYRQILPGATNLSFDGNLMVYSFSIPSEETEGVTVTILEKRNFKTGWTHYYHTKESNETATIMELELSIEDVSLPGFELTSILIVLSLITLVIFKRRKYP